VGKGNTKKQKSVKPKGLAVFFLAGEPCVDFSFFPDKGKNKLREKLYLSVGSALLIL
jgi:hypothetical protein